MGSVDFKAVASAALAQAEQLVPRWLPNGRSQGHEWVAANPKRPDSDGSGAFSVNLHTGRWGDFASKLGGLDLISLYAYLHDVSNSEAARAIAADLNVDVGGAIAHRAPTARTGSDAGDLIVPAPADAPSFENALHHYKLGPCAAHWVYRDARGAVLMVVARWNTPTEKDPAAKQIMPLTLRRAPSGMMQWRYLGLPPPRPLYRLDELARRPDATVIVCEGEKAADAAQLLLPEFVVVTSPNGASNAEKADWSPLAGRRVLLWPDHDAGGLKYVSAVRRELLDAGAIGVQLLSFLFVAKALAASRGGELPKVDEPTAPTVELHRDTPRGPLEIGYLACHELVGLCHLFDTDPVGFDAADLVKLGVRREHMPSLELVELVEPPRDEPTAPPSAAAPDVRDQAEAGSGGRKRRSTTVADAHLALVEYLLADLQRRAIEPRAGDGWRHKDTGVTAEVSLKRLAADQWFDLLKAGRDHSIGFVTDTLGVLAERMSVLRRKALVDRIVGHPTEAAGVEALKAWVRGVTGRDDTTDVRVMAHWLWLVKRCAVGQRTEWEVMPVVWGTEHGSGKTTAIEKLVTPLEELALAINAATLTDERRYRPLHTLLVGRWEEMSGAARSDLEALKNTITTHEIVYRELATHSMVVARRTMSFIATSNHTVDTMIADTTGARRFYQLNALPKLDHELINRIDPVMIWRAVSESDRAPIHDVIHVVRGAQAELVHRDAVSMFLEAEEWHERLVVKRVDSDSPLTVLPYDPINGCSFEDVAARFKHWSNAVGQAGIGVKALAQRLKQEGWRKVRGPVVPGRPRGWKYLMPATKPTDPNVPDGVVTPENAPDPAGAGESSRPPRGARLASDPAPDEDRFAGGGGLAF